MIPLTPTQHRLLEFLRTRNLCPSYQEMADHMGVKSKSNVHRILRALEERGFIRRIPRGVRAVELVDRRSPLAAVTTAALEAELQARRAAPGGSLS